MKVKIQLDEAKFLQGPALKLSVEGTLMEAKPRKFSSGSLGYYATGKALVLVNGQPVQVQVGCNLTIIGTKPEKVGE